MNWRFQQKGVELLYTTFASFWNLSLCLILLYFWLAKVPSYCLVLAVFFLALWTGGSYTRLRSKKPRLLPTELCLARWWDQPYLFTLSPLFPWAGRSCLSLLSQFWLCQENQYKISPQQMDGKFRLFWSKKHSILSLNQRARSPFTTWIMSLIVDTIEANIACVWLFFQYSLAFYSVWATVGKIKFMYSKILLEFYRTTKRIWNPLFEPLICFWPEIFLGFYLLFAQNVFAFSLWRGFRSVAPCDSRLFENLALCSVKWGQICLSRNGRQGPQIQICVCPPSD